MKNALFLIVILIGTLAATPSWACHFKGGPNWTLSGFENPESAYYDAATDTIYVSNVSGAPTTKDGKGFISTVSPDGKMKELHWISGLNAPKGIRVFQGFLYVSDIDRLVKIDIAKKKIVRKTLIPKAKFLNDVAVDPAGNVYVSDTVGNIVYVLNPEGKVSTFLEGPQTEGPNGILVDGDYLFIAGWGKNVKMDLSSEGPGRLLAVNLKTKALSPVTPNPIGHTDGLERDGANDWIVSDWTAGKIIHVNLKGQVYDMITLKPGTADIGFIPKGNLVLIPQMQENTLSAYQIR